MSLLGKVELKTTELQDALEFTVMHEGALLETVAIPAITTLGYAGILAGPAAIGFVAQISSLSIAFLAVGLLLVGVAASGRVLRVQ